MRPETGSDQKTPTFAEKTGRSTPWIVMPLPIKLGAGKMAVSLTCLA
jgi:hypothetical protein